MKYSITLDWEMACQWWGYTREGFAALDVDEQARIIAVYRTSKLMESVVAQYQIDEMKRNT